jgi:hypothetical protein
MDCAVCPNKSESSCLECQAALCSCCQTDCETCGNTMCMECTDECDICEKEICTSCTFYTQTCKCCKRDVGSINAVPLCIICTITNWFSADDAEGFWCAQCNNLCGQSKYCKLNVILANQTECPICYDPLPEDSYQLQVCDLHKICKNCNYDTTLGCPICRVGCA